MGDGHYFVNDPGLFVDKPIKIIGDEHEPAHVILELSGEIVWKSSGGWMEGVTIRRSSLAKTVSRHNEILKIDSYGRLDVFNCVFDNKGSLGNCTSVGIGSRVRWEKAIISGGSEDGCGLHVAKNATVELINVSIMDNDGIGLVCDESAVMSLNGCSFERNGLSPPPKHTKRKRLESDSSLSLIADAQRQ